MNNAITVGLALVLDGALGEPRLAHPLVLFGRLATATEAWWYGPSVASDTQRRLRGVLAAVVLVVPPAVVAWWLSTFPKVGPVTTVLLLYLTLGGQSLAQHATRVSNALRTGNLGQARHRTSHLVSRDVTDMGATQLVAATVESVLENGCDAVFGALFWFLLAGAPGAVAYRLANTLDAMWGYRTPRYWYFGWAAARLDDLLNLVPARLTAATYALVGDSFGAMRCWRRQARSWESRNAGAVMAAGAGALQVRLGGPACYHGRLRARPLLGVGKAPETDDITRAIALVRRGVLVWVLATVLWMGVSPSA